MALVTIEAGWRPNVARFSRTTGPRPPKRLAPCGRPRRSLQRDSLNDPIIATRNLPGGLAPGGRLYAPPQNGPIELVGKYMGR